MSFMWMLDLKLLKKEEYITNIINDLQNVTDLYIYVCVYVCVCEHFNVWNY